MSLSTNLFLEAYSPLGPKQPLDNFLLKWRQGQLLVKSSHKLRQPHLQVLENQQWLVECLEHSSVRLVRIEHTFSETGLKLWADAAEQSKRKVFLKTPCNHQLPEKHSPIRWRLKRLMDWLVSALLVLSLSPLMLLLALLIYIYSPGPIFYRQWRVGRRGQLFRMIKFRTMVVDAEKLHHQVMINQSGLHKLQDDPRMTPLGGWMRKYSFDELPQLFNVLRGEMSLVGPRPWALYDALRIRPEGQKRLNALPGITGLWQVEARSTLLDLDEVNNLDLHYLRKWSLTQDLRILITTVPKVLFGFGAY